MSLVVKLTYCLLLLALAFATVADKLYGSRVASESFYSSWWFVFLWAALAVCGLGLMMRRRLFRRPVVFGIHVGLLFVLAGALVTHFWGVHGDVQVRMGESVSSFQSDGQKLHFPFELRLDKFEVLTYPGTQSPMDFVSHVSFRSQGVLQLGEVSMNNVCEHLGYRFYQSGYDPDGRGAHFRVCWDPWGIGLTYFGYFLLFASLLLWLALPGESFRVQLRHLSSGVVCVLFCFTSCRGAEPPMPQTLPQDVAEAMADLHVYYNGRVCPLHTVAKDFTVKLYGKSRFRGLSSEQVFTGWYFYPSSWSAQPIIKVKAAVSARLGVQGRCVCYSDFFDNAGYKLKPLLSKARVADDVSVARALSDSDEKVSLVLGLMGGQSFKIFPIANADGLAWYSCADDLPSSLPDDEWTFVRRSFDVLGEMAVAHRYDDMLSFVSKLKAYQVRNAQSVLPSQTKSAAEKLYNSLGHSRPLSMTLATLGVVFFLVYVLLWSRGRSIPVWVDIPLVAVLAVSFCAVGFQFVLRGYVSGHVPLSNGHETMQFMSLCVLALALFLHRRFELVVPFGLLISGLTLLVSMMGESNPQVTNLMPVLASPLLSIHVCVIMLAYSLVAFVMLCGVASFFVSDLRRVERLAAIGRLMLAPAVVALTIGIFVGAIWANQSWGRYWGWDPKEVWALITLLIYVLPLHPSLVPALARPRAFHVFAVVAFLSVLMTYFGVNFLLGGLHSYA